MDFNKTFILFVSLSCLILHTNAVRPPRTPEARVYTICKPTTNPSVCFKSILPKAMQVGKFNMYKALEIEINATQQQVQKTVGVIAGLLTKPGNSKSLIDSLTTCKDQYDNMLDSIDVSIKEVAQRNVVEARFKFSSVLSYHASCNDEFTDVASPIANDAQGVYDLGGNCLDIMKAIEDRESRRKTGGGKVPSTPPSSSSYGGPCNGVVGTCS